MQELKKDMMIHTEYGITLLTPVFEQPSGPCMPGRLLYLEIHQPSSIYAGHLSYPASSISSRKEPSTQSLFTCPNEKGAHSSRLR